MDRQSREFAEAVEDAVKQSMFGVDEVVRLSLVALYTGGHVLLEGNPGLGKTELVKTLGQVLKLPFGRIQFTPDLMPADSTGTFMPDFENHNSQNLVFRRGPIFTSLLLADEINRATPKTQAAMLEAMAEQQVTVLGRKETLDIPFMVLATQNPIDNEGTYNLPEAQADRFMFKISMPVPDRDTLNLIVDKHTGMAVNSANQNEPKNSINSHLLPADQDASKKEYKRLRQKIVGVERSPWLKIHINNMFQASNRRFDQLKELDGGQKERIYQLVGLMRYGLGPRAAIVLTLGAQAWTLLFLPEADCAAGPALARVVIPTLRHRVKPGFDWDEQYREINQTAIPPLRWKAKAGQNSEDNSGLLERMLADFCHATAPKTNKYQHSIAANLAQVIQERDW